MKDHLIEKNPVLKCSIEFSLMIIEYCELLLLRKKFVLGNQLLRSGTGIGANIIEAQNSESKADFIHKFKLAAKEADETQYWLILCKHSDAYPDCSILLSKLEQIQRLLAKILSTSKLKSN